MYLLKICYVLSFCNAVLICFIDQLLFQILIGRETNHKQPGKTTSVKFTSKPLLTKASTSNKKGLKKNITAAHIRKEIGKQIFWGLLFFSNNTERLLNLSRRCNKASDSCILL